MPPRARIVLCTLTGLALAPGLLAVVGCGSSSGSHGDGNGGDPPGTEVVVLDETEFTYALSEGTASLPLFTTPATRRARPGDRAPTATRSGLHLSAARNEFEPVQLLLGPGSGSVRVELLPFTTLGDSSRAEVKLVGFRDGLADTLTPLGEEEDVALSEDGLTGLWLTLFIAPDAKAGDHESQLRLTPAGGEPIEVPVTAHVFDFTLPDEAHFGTQINIGISDLIPSGGGVDDAKTLLFEHRMTPTSATWPSGFSYNITWDNPASPNRCSSFYDEPDEADEYSIGALSRRYLLGQGWNGVGFHNAELFQFVDNSTPRPDTFCGISRGDHFGTDEYNDAWSAWLSALDDYLVDNGMAERGYYYVQNEPQDAEDDRLAAHLCRITRAAAPHLRIAISEEPKPSIAEDTDGACGYDIWIAHVRAYQETYAWQRQRDFGESVWFYSLDHDPAPYFNPTVSTNQGLHERIIPWAAWSHRITGWAYYDGARFFDGPNPTVRAELLREGFEDYEYLWLANGSASPGVDETLPIDATVRSVAASMTSFTKDPDALMALRHELGRYLSGERDTLPTLTVESARPRAAYYINFQDPSGSPTENPLVVEGNTYLKVGWDPYSAELGYGWSGEYIDDPGIALYGFDDTAGYSVLSQSYLYDDYGRDNLFEFDLAPGRYAITVGVGRPAHGYPNDPHNVSIEGTKVVNDELTTDETPVLVRTTTLDISDGSLSMVVGGRSDSTSEYAYTFLGFLAIEPVE